MKGENEVRIRNRNLPGPEHKTTGGYETTTKFAWIGRHDVRKGARIKIHVMDSKRGLHALTKLPRRLGGLT